MKLRSIYINNFRGIEELNISFQYGMNANIYGANGVGKSTIATAIKCLFMPITIGATEVFNVYDMFGSKCEIKATIEKSNKVITLKKVFDSKNGISCFFDDELISLSQEEYQSVLENELGIKPLTWEALTYPTMKMKPDVLYNLLHQYIEDISVKDVISSDRELFTLIDDIESISIEPKLQKLNYDIADIKEDITFCEKQAETIQNNINKSANLQDIEELFKANEELTSLKEQNNELDYNISKLKAQYSPEVLTEKIKLLELNIATQEEILVKNKEKARATRERIYKDSELECEKARKVFESIENQLKQREEELPLLQEQYNNAKILYDSIETGSRKTCNCCGKKYDQESRTTATNKARKEMQSIERSLKDKQAEIDKLKDKLQKVELSITKAETLMQKAYSEWLNFDFVETTENVDLLKLRTELRRTKSELERQSKTKEIEDMIAIKEANTILIEEKQTILEVNKNIVYHQKKLQKIYQEKKVLNDMLTECEIKKQLYEKFKNKLYSMQTQSIQRKFKDIRIEMDYDNKTAHIYSQDSLVKYQDENTAKQIEIALRFSDCIALIEQWNGFVILDNIESVDSLYSNRQIITMHKLSSQPIFNGYCELDYIQQYADATIKNGNKELYIKYY